MYLKMKYFIAPITTHQGTIKQVEGEYEQEIINEVGCKTIKREKKIENIIEYLDVNGKLKTKKLDFYEVPIKIEPGYRKEIKGYVNVTQIRTVSKKRLEKMPVAKISNETEKNINDAIKKTLGIS